MGRRTITVKDDSDHSGVDLDKENCVLYPLRQKVIQALTSIRLLVASQHYTLCQCKEHLICHLFLILQRSLKKMPKTTCRNCYENMPVQFLAAHVASCKTVTLSDEETACPICDQLYPSDTVEFHASYCGERVFDETEAFDTDRTEICPKRLRTHQEIKSIADVIKSLTERVDESSSFSICVTREQMVERGIKQWQRQKKSSPKNAIRVTFIGEAGIDSGALKTEFLTEIISGIEKRFFEGGDGGKNPKYSMTDLDKHNFKVIGEIFAVSIAQGGPPPNFFSQWCYKYISTGEVDQEAITERDITDPEVMELIKEILAADNTTVMEFTDRILSCGYTGAVSFEKKEEIVRETGTMRRARESKVVNFLQDYLQDMEDEGESKDDRDNRPEEESMGEEDKAEKHTNTHINVSKFCQWLTGQSHIP
ncbi:G2/M phase-specific E3 ubiquitin-protein ligase [Anabarilius grahami]|uniref:G2/M phase-specific E3 ubiquitin-protein ligase n=1 Tax=Anabarilius grahami TaxID=495550 RepID=A0A3N0YGU4_ANAGA|nr:G2/M phase-specific E3 ubiquitin-protein ligase [Anabarilius grahami]